MEGIVLGLKCVLPLHPLPLGRALLLLQLLLHPLPIPLFLLLIHLVGMTQGLGLLRHLLLIRDYPGGPGPLAQGAFYDPFAIIGNSNCSTRDLHSEVYFDLSDFAEDLELRDCMHLVQRYSLEPFMTPRRFFYPWVVIEFYHTMTSKRVHDPTVIHFSIDGHEGTLQAANIATAFHFPAVLANSVDYRLWPHSLPREMVHILSRDVAAGSIPFRRQLPPSLLLIDHILLSNIFPLHHNVQRR